MREKHIKIDRADDNIYRSAQTRFNIIILKESKLLGLLVYKKYI